jgi:sugar O-acyltransferase (sialic acid O-acetyltransferase NeuD family)
MASEAQGQLSRRRVAGLGAGGHARVLIEVLKLDPTLEVAELLDPARIGQAVGGVPVTFGDDRLPGLAPTLDAVFVGVGGVGDTGPRRRLFEMARALGLEVLTIIHPAAVISPSAQIGRGAQVLASAVVATGAEIGQNAIVNTGALVDHDCRVGAHAHIATGACLSGQVVVGEGAHVGTGAAIRQGVNIGAGAIVGAGAVVVSDVPAGAVVVGVPAHLLRHRETGA